MPKIFTTVGYFVDICSVHHATYVRHCEIYSLLNIRGTYLRHRRGMRTSVRGAILSGYGSASSLRTETLEN